MEPNELGASACVCLRSLLAGVVLLGVTPPPTAISLYPHAVQNATPVCPVAPHALHESPTSTAALLAPPPPVEPVSGAGVSLLFPALRDLAFLVPPPLLPRTEARNFDCEIPLPSPPSAFTGNAGIVGEMGLCGVPATSPTPPTDAAAAARRVDTLRFCPWVGAATAPASALAPGVLNAPESSAEVGRRLTRLINLLVLCVAGVNCTIPVAAFAAGIASPASFRTLPNKTSTCPSGWPVCASVKANRKQTEGRGGKYGKYSGVCE